MDNLMKSLNKNWKRDEKVCVKCRVEQLVLNSSCSQPWGSWFGLNNLKVLETFGEYRLKS